MVISHEADVLATRLLASYPGWPVSEMSIGALAEAFDRMGLDIAADVALRVQSENEKPPSVATLFETAREVRAERGRAEQPPLYALPAGEVLEEWPPEVAEKVHAMIEGHKVDVEEQIAADTAEWERIKRATKASLRLAGACDGSGKDAVKIDGQWCCPGCGQPLESA